MRSTIRATAPRGASALADLSGRLKCDRQAEEILRVFWGDLGDGGLMPPELRGLAEGAQSGPPGSRRVLVYERDGERLRVEVVAIGRGKTQLHLWREPVHVPSPAPGNGATGLAAPADGAATATDDGLTPREREVALLVADGLRSREVAERLGIAAQTVKSHLKTIFDKLGVRNRVELTRRLSLH
jgi:DNA-binding CsgD family transcriptional regulator